ncbi:hypothetical protein ATANTOWER_018321 [Ataeniobius toweri]|uniref:Uncharacterized protein n=1 Tax=Ataeniobius toweri TaxID=208326 RepID=A0ABU7AFX4_9TELE|nr:hypothetical protein [Ataeniobius toweri]
MLSLPGLSHGQPCLGMFAAMPYCFHFQGMTESSSVRCSNLGIFYMFYNSVLLLMFLQPLCGVLGLHDAVCSGMFSDKPLRSSQNSCIYTETLNYIHVASI